jgi:hypothetical protein
MLAASTGAVITVIESRRVDIRVATVPGTLWRDGMLMETGKVPGASSPVTRVFLRVVFPGVSLGLRTSVRCSEWRKARASPDLR